MSHKKRSIIVSSDEDEEPPKKKGSKEISINLKNLSQVEIDTLLKHNADESEEADISLDSESETDTNGIKSKSIQKLKLNSSEESTLNTAKFQNSSDSTSSDEMKSKRKTERVSNKSEESQSLKKNEAIKTDSSDEEGFSSQKDKCHTESDNSSINIKINTCNVEMKDKRVKRKSKSKRTSKSYQDVLSDNSSDEEPLQLKFGKKICTKVSLKDKLLENEDSELPSMESKNSKTKTKLNDSSSELDSDKSKKSDLLQKKFSKSGTKNSLSKQYNEVANSNNASSDESTKLSSKDCSPISKHKNNSFDRKSSPLRSSDSSSDSEKPLSSIKSISSKVNLKVSTKSSEIRENEQSKTVSSSSSHSSSSNSSSSSVSSEESTKKCTDSVSKKQRNKKKNLTLKSKKDSDVYFSELSDTENKEKERSSVNLEDEGVVDNDSIKVKNLKNDSSSETSISSEHEQTKQEQKKNRKSQKGSSLKEGKNANKDPLLRNKRYLRTMGVNIRNYEKFFKGCKSLKSKKDKILKLMEENGLKGQPSLEKCKKIRRVVPDYVFEPNPDSAKLEERMKGDGDPVAFALQKNLTVLVKQIKLDCCVGVEVWNVATRGLCNVGQEELVILLEVNPGEKSPPPHIFSFLHTVYQQANKGNLVTELGHTIFTEPEGFLGSKDHGGFLYIRPTYQCLHKLILPPAPYIFAVLIQKWETPWAKVFPLRLMLRLGAEFRYYPCPLVSTRNRKPVYCEIGHTIMNLLVDFRNYAYTIPVVQGFVIHMEDKKTTLLIPKNRYEQVWKALNNSNDHVLALGANFSPSSDSHLVTVEDDDGQYTTQAINIHNKPRKVTGASFIVFNGALKSNSGLKAKSSIVEDGLMVQIAGEMMTKLRECLRNMKDFDIPCGPATSTPDELVLVRWVQDDKNFNVGIKSPIDGQQMDGVPSVKIHSGTDYVSNDHLIRWTEVFIIQGETTTSTSDVNVSRLAESLALACCVALTPHLALLYDSGPNRLALRATIHQDNVGYEAGMGGAKLMPLCMNELDTELVPVIHRAAASITDQAIILELLFHIMEQ